LIEYWAGELQVTQGHLRQAIDRVGGEIKNIRKYLSNGYRICIQDDDGVQRLIMKISFLSDGVAASVPYHKDKSGWLMKFPLNYSQRQFVVPLNDMQKFTVSDTVKLSMHMTGFVQFSTGGQKPILSGWNKALGQPKGVGLKVGSELVVTSGPLFGASVYGMNGFQASAGKPAELFQQKDLWHHPEFSNPSAKGFHIEVFMIPIELLSSTVFSDGKRTLDLQLPFMSQFRFKHTLRILEVPRQDFCLGAIVSRIPPDSRLSSGYKLFGPGCTDESGNSFSIFAQYPGYDEVEFQPSKSLDYIPPNPTEAG